MIASEFQQLRLAAGLSRSELAERLGCTQNAIHKWESGARRSIPSEAADMLRKIAKEKKR